MGKSGLTDTSGVDVINGFLAEVVTKLEQNTDVRVSQVKVGM